MFTVFSYQQNRPRSWGWRTRSVHSGKGFETSFRLEDMGALRRVWLRYDAFVCFGIFYVSKPLQSICKGTYTDL